MKKKIIDILLLWVAYHIRALRRQSSVPLRYGCWRDPLPPSCRLAEHLTMLSWSDKAGSSGRCMTSTVLCKIPSLELNVMDQWKWCVCDQKLQFKKTILGNFILQCGTWWVFIVNTNINISQHTTVRRKKHIGTALVQSKYLHKYIITPQVPPTTHLNTQ